MSISALNRTLPDWLTRIRTRQTVLPRFQRFEAWAHGDVAQLFNTILQGLPVGSLLVLEIGNDEPFISRTIEGAPKTGERVTEHLLDGQQRLTALWRGLHNNYEDRTYFVYLVPDEETGMPYYGDSIGRWKNDGDTERRPFWANRAADLWSRRMIPLDLFAPGEEHARRFREWAKGAIENRDERDEIFGQVAQIRESLATFNLPYLSLPVTTKKETALSVFIKMNTSAAPLSTYDIVVAQVEAGLGASLHDLVADIKQSCPAIVSYYPPDDLALYANALLQSRAPSNASYMNKDFGPRLLENWDRFLKGVMRAVAFLEEERVFDAQRLPTDVVVPVLVALWALTPEGLDGEGRARTLMRRYLWRAFFTNRYERTTGSRSLEDFNALKDCIASPATSVPAIFDDKQYPLPTPLELASAGWPTRKDRLARAILALALKQGGLDLADGSTASRNNLGKREYHHLFPDAHLRRINVPDDTIFLSLNCALVTWRTNRTISDKEPERYLTERRDGSVVGETEIRARLETHLIPYDEMLAGDYGAFIDKRVAMVHAAMMKCCAG